MSTKIRDEILVALEKKLQASKEDGEDVIKSTLMECLEDLDISDEKIHPKKDGRFIVFVKCCEQGEIDCKHIVYVKCCQQAEKIEFQFHSESENGTKFSEEDDIFLLLWWPKEESKRTFWIAEKCKIKYLFEVDQKNPPCWDIREKIKQDISWLDKKAKATDERLKNLFKI